MNWTSAAAIAIFAATLILMIKRPRGIRLGYAAGIGAAASLLLGTVSLGQAAQSFLNIWDAALAFIGIVALSVTLDAMGFFKWAALRVVKSAGGNGLKLYFYVALLTAAVSILFANDSAVLILTPIVLEIVICIGVNSPGRMAYLFSAGLIADTAAMPLITSNPINILSADYFHYTFIQHLIFMGPIAIATITTSLLLVYLLFRKENPKNLQRRSSRGIEYGETANITRFAQNQYCHINHNRCGIRLNFHLEDTSFHSDRFRSHFLDFRLLGNHQKRASLEQREEGFEESGTRN